VTCGGDVCTVECSGGGACHSNITCTAAHCGISCSAGDTCNQKVTCASAASCSISCSNNAVCANLDLGARDAAVSCGVGTGGNDCNNVSCYADGGQCKIGCGGNDCQGTICCSGKCTGTNNGSNVNPCP
jgi:hypothetical protein